MPGIRLLLILSAIVFAFGCAGPGRHLSHPTKLSKAMEKASDDYHGSRNIQTDSQPHSYDPPQLRHEEPCHSPPERVPPPSSSPESAASPSSKEGAQPSVFGLTAGYGFINGEDIYRIDHLDISAGGYLDANQRVEGFIGIGYPLIDETAELNRSVDGIWLSTIGLRYKYFTTPRYTFLGHYFTAGAAYTSLRWTYENPIQAGDKQIKNDALEGLELFVGMGLNLAQTENFQLGLEILPSVILWNGDTSEGFDNDVFGDFYALKLRLTLSYLP